MQPGFQLAATFGDADTLRARIADGHPVDAVDAGGRTALMLAAEAGHDAVCAMLVELGADPNHRDRRGRLAADLMAGVSRAPAPPDLPPPPPPEPAPPRMTPRVQLAAAFGDVSTLRLCFAAGQPLDAVDADGRTALMLAAEAGNDDAYALLIELGADATRRDRRGRLAADLRASRAAPAPRPPVDGPAASTAQPGVAEAEAPTPAATAAPSPAEAPAPSAPTSADRQNPHATRASTPDTTRPTNTPTRADGPNPTATRALTPDTTRPTDVPTGADGPSPHATQASTPDTTLPTDAASAATVAPTPRADGTSSRGRAKPATPPADTPPPEPAQPPAVAPASTPPAIVLQHPVTPLDLPLRALLATALRDGRLSGAGTLLSVPPLERLLRDLFADPSVPKPPPHADLATLLIDGAEAHRQLARTVYGAATVSRIPEPSAATLLRRGFDQATLSLGAHLRRLAPPSTATLQHAVMTVALRHGLPPDPTLDPRRELVRTGIATGATPAFLTYELRHLIAASRRHAQALALRWRPLAETLAATHLGGVLPDEEIVILAADSVIETIEEARRLTPDVVEPEARARMARRVAFAAAAHVEPRVTRGALPAESPSLTPPPLERLAFLAWVQMPRGLHRDLLGHRYGLWGVPPKSLDQVRRTADVSANEARRELPIATAAVRDQVDRWLATVERDHRAARLVVYQRRLAERPFTEDDLAVQPEPEPPERHRAPGRHTPRPPKARWTPKPGSALEVKSKVRASDTPARRPPVARDGIVGALERALREHLEVPGVSAYRATVTCCLGCTTITPGGSPRCAECAGTAFTTRPSPLDQWLAAMWEADDGAVGAFLDDHADQGWTARAVAAEASAWAAERLEGLRRMRREAVG